MSGKKPREIATQVLQHFQRSVSERRGGPFAEELLENALRGASLSAVDRALCQELVYGVVRWQGTLDWLIGRRTEGRKQKPMLQTLLRLGLYQIFWLERIPDHAAVHETVELARQNGFGAQAGFVNAVLRAYLREFDATKQLLVETKTSQPHVGYSHPEWLVTRWQNRWGNERAGHLMEWNNTPPKTFARVNTLKTDTAKLLALWREEKVEWEAVCKDWIEDKLVFELKAHPPLDQLPSFRQGWFYVQDPGTLLAVRELDPQPGESVLDFCAAPGGKLTYIALLMRNEGRLVAQDISPERLRLVEENCERLGVKCGEVRSRGSLTLTPSPSYGEREPVPEQCRIFDRVLVDAPCSNTGAMRRRVDVRWRIRPEEIERLCALQLDLLGQAAECLKPGGVMVYSTCSLEPEENSEVVKVFLRGRGDFQIEQDSELLPFVDGVDGAYVALLRRSQQTHPAERQP